MEFSSSTTNPAVEGNDSPSSVVAEATMSDSQEQLATNENCESDEKAEKERKLRRLNRRKALAVERSPLPTPKLGRVLASDNNTIDLTNEDDDPDTQWFKKTFNSTRTLKTKSPEASKPFAVPHSTSRNAPRSLLIRDTLKKKLQASMSIKRRKEQEQRRKMYEEDNEHLKQPSDDDEEEEVIIRKKKQTRPKTEKGDDEYNSEDDEDYKEGDSSEDELDDKSSKEKQPSEANGRADDEMSVNFLDDSFTYDVFNIKKRPGPGSTISNYDVRSQSDETEKAGAAQMPFMEGIACASNEMDDILGLCSGNFDSGPRASNGDQEDFPDTLQMLIRDEKSAKTERLPVSIEPMSSTPINSDNEEESVVKKKPMKTNRVMDSDEEDEIVEETPQQESEQNPSEDPFGSEGDKLMDPVEERDNTVLRRIVLSEDENSEEEEEAEEGEEEEADENIDEDDLDEEEVKEAETEEPEPNFDDEDDELAVIKRIEHQEYKQKIKKKTFFDDEASLSGDDVGSDVEDDAENDDYEAEEGDADDVPDADTIRRQNHKLLLKQESDKEQRALAKLQDRLLADGDLGGVETNRQFRFKLREEVEIKVTEGENFEEEREDDEAEEDEDKKKERAEIIKYKIEHAEELMLIDDPGDDNDLFKRAGQLMRTTEKIVAERSEEITVKPRVGKPSLLSKTALAVSFQEVLTGGTAAPKQMYVQNFNPSSGETDPVSSRLSTGAVKRNRQSPDLSAAKRVRQSKLSLLE